MGLNGKSNYKANNLSKIGNRTKQSKGKHEKESGRIK